MEFDGIQLNNRPQPNSYISLSTTPCQRRCSIASLQKEFQVWKAAALPVSCFAKTHPADAYTFHFTLAKATTIFLFIPFISFHIWQQKYQSDFQINQIKYCFRNAPLSYLLFLLPGGGAGLLWQFTNLCWHSSFQMKKENMRIPVFMIFIFMDVPFTFVLSLSI